MTQTNEIQMPVPSGFIRGAVVLVSVIAGLSAIPGIYLSIGEFGGFAAAIFGFESMVLVAAIFGILVGLGRFRDGFGLALMCLAGTILVVSVFGIYVDARPKIGDRPDLQPWVQRMLMIRMGIVVGYSALASLAVFARDARCWVCAIRSACLFIPAILIVVGVMKFGLPFGGASGEPNAMRVISFLVIAMVVGGLVSVGGHLLIRAYEYGRMENDLENPENDAKPRLEHKSRN